ncbi:MAG: GTPase domain-containing protein [bacterium]|nr:GTPase domain-containing protein [bacterium]
MTPGSEREPRSVREPGGAPDVRRAVLCGPGRAGKTATLEFWAGLLGGPAPAVALPSAATAGDAFEYLTVPAAAGRPPLHLLTTPGRLACGEERRLLLRGADAVVFTADSRRWRQDANLILLDELGAELADADRAGGRVPLLLQYNRRDDPDALPLAELEALLNPVGWPSVPTVASSGEGLPDLLALLLARLR